MTTEELPKGFPIEGKTCERAIQHTFPAGLGQPYKTTCGKQATHIMENGLYSCTKHFNSWFRKMMRGAERNDSVNRILKLKELKQ